MQSGEPASSVQLQQAGVHTSAEHQPHTTLYALERTIALRRQEMEQQQQQQGAGEDHAVSRAGQGTHCGVRHKVWPRWLLCCAEQKKPSWTARLLSDPTLLCKKVREEAGELCQTLEQSEGRERAASEMADLLYHSMVLLNLQVRALCVRRDACFCRCCCREGEAHVRAHDVLCLLQGVPFEEVLAVLRKRFGTSGVEEKAARKPKAQ